MADANKWITHWEAKPSDQLPRNPLPGYKFKVYIQGVEMGFSKITNMETLVETEPLAEGGVNDYVHSLRKPVTTERTLTLERGMIGVSDMKALTQILMARFSVGQRLPIDMVITISGRSGKLERIYFVHGAVVKKWQCSPLDAMSGSFLVESFELAYETLEDQTAIAMAASAFGISGI
ncbi:phage tail protein [Clostridiaceae bacterium NSJ-31]|uniref:Phage tail protein n=1 Tax=Ligaoa zhengdingensis TaxID=2763658 RepID=A0A926E0H3_9FIRM|nr:phage tail protein [Ligaoa zhengdingensis]MBC8546570.1 phage tail protein [Ligaoa zhengdingensis]